MKNVDSWIFVFIAAVNSTIGNVLLKKSSESLIGNFFDMAFNFRFLAGLFFYGLSVVFFAKGLTNLPVSIAYPVLASSGFILLAISSGFFLNERLSITQWCGMGTILIGIYLLANSQ